METPIFRKTVQGLIGIVLFFMLLEAGLRLGGFILLSVQEHENLISVRQKGAYRILCLGESTTQRQYPQSLEQVLNQRNFGIRFSVIDEGKTGTNTRNILGEIEAYLNEYHPDMVVTMMGINDTGVQYYKDISEANAWFFRHCRVYRFVRIIFMNFLMKFQHRGIYKSERTGPCGKADLKDQSTLDEDTASSNGVPVNRFEKLDVRNDKKRFGTEGSSVSRVELFDAVKFSEKAAELSFMNDNSFFELGQRYREQGKLSLAEDSFKKVLELNPKNSNACFALGWLYRQQNKFAEAEGPFLKAMEINPGNYHLSLELAWLYLKQGKFPQAENLVEKAINLNPNNADIFLEIGKLYRIHGKYSQAEEFLEKSIQLNTAGDNAYLELGRLFQERGNFTRAEALFNKAIEINPESDSAMGAMVSLCEEQGKSALAKEYAQKYSRLRTITASNYRKLKEITDRKGIKLVCVQYPMRSVEPLKKTFSQDENVIFVDNQGVFKEAVKKEGYKEYFRDMFGGDFGHCTQKGNELLAQNIANVILKEVFNQ